MPTSLTVVTPPASEPITRAEARAHLRLDVNSGTPTISESIAPATYASGLQTGSSVSVSGYSAAMMVTVNTIASGTVGFTIFESADNSTFTTWGSTGALSAGGTYYLPYTGTQPYVRAVGGSLTSSADYSAAFLLTTGATDESGLIDDLIADARETVENDTRQALITQTLRYTLDVFPGWEIELPKPPLQSISSISYIDQQGNTVTLASTDYVYDARSMPARVTPPYGKVWPIPRYVENAVTIDYVAGYGASTDVPKRHKQLVKRWVTHLYEHRGDDGIDVPPDILRLTARASHGGYS